MLQTEFGHIQCFSTTFNLESKSDDILLSQTPFSQTNMLNLKGFNMDINEHMALLHEMQINCLSFHDNIKVKIEEHINRPIFEFLSALQSAELWDNVMLKQSEHLETKKKAISEFHSNNNAIEEEFKLRKASLKDALLKFQSKIKTQNFIEQICHLRELLLDTLGNIISRYSVIDNVQMTPYDTNSLINSSNIFNCLNSQSTEFNFKLLSNSDIPSANHNTTLDNTIVQSSPRESETLQIDLETQMKSILFCSDSPDQSVKRFRLLNTPILRIGRINFEMYSKKSSPFLNLKAILAHCSYESAVFNATKLKRSQWSHIVCILHSNRVLTKVILSNMKIDSLRIWSDMLSGTSISEFILSYCFIDSVSAFKWGDLFNPIKDNHVNLKVLRYICCDLDDLCAEDLKNALHKNSYIETIDLTDNHFSFQGEKEIREGLMQSQVLRI